MSNKLIDAFADMDLSEYKQENRVNAKIKKVKLEKDEIKALAEESNFQSRQPVKPKGKRIIPRTFSLFQEEYDIINNALREYLLADLGNYQPSSSDVIRAALFLLTEKKPDEIVRLIKRHRGRGRKS